LFFFFPLLLFADSLSDSNKLFNFAEKEYPEYFSPAGMPTFELDEDGWILHDDIITRV